MTNRYLAFSGDTFYPEGGFNDFRGAASTVEDALALVLNNKDSYDWWHIVDSESLKIVKQG